MGGEPYRLGVEVKTAGQKSVVRQQLTRYAQSGAFDSLLLLTTDKALAGTWYPQMKTPLLIAHLDATWDPTVPRVRFAAGGGAARRGHRLPSPDRF